MRNVQGGGGTFYPRGGTVCPSAECPGGHCALVQNIRGGHSARGDNPPSHTGERGGGGWGGGGVSRVTYPGPQGIIGAPRYNRGPKV